MKAANCSYPPQTGAYAVKVKNGAGWRDFDVARFQISVGQPYHEGEKLRSTLDWADHRFNSLVVCVNDTLQRFNYMFEDGMSEDEAFNHSLKLGYQWIERNRPLLESLENVSCYRWEDWRKHQSYQASYDQVLSLYANNKEFREAIDQNVMDFWNRRQSRGGLSDHYRFDRFHIHSRDYLLEETAAFSLMFEEQEAADIYPGTLLLPCTVFKGRNIEGAPLGLLKGTHNTRIDFKRQTPHKLEALPSSKVA